MTELEEARAYAISGYVLASSLEEAERGTGRILTERYLCIPEDAPDWLAAGVRSALGTPIGDIEIP